MLVDRFTEELKEMIRQKNILIDKRASLFESVRKGRLFFIENRAGENISNLLNGSNRMVELATELEAIDVEIQDIDIMITAKIEAYSTDYVYRFEGKKSENTLGEVINTTDSYIVPEKFFDNRIEVDVNDIWFLKIAKKAINPRNINVIKKDEYYSNNISK